jgi:hypothetical protein
MDFLTGKRLGGQSEAERKCKFFTCAGEDSIVKILWEKVDERALCTLGLYGYKEWVRKIKRLTEGSFLLWVVPFSILSEYLR